MDQDNEDIELEPVSCQSCKKYKKIESTVYACSLLKEGKLEENKLEEIKKAFNNWNIDGECYCPEYEAVGYIPLGQEKSHWDVHYNLFILIILIAWGAFFWFFWNKWGNPAGVKKLGHTELVPEMQLLGEPLKSLVRTYPFVIALGILLLVPVMIISGSTKLIPVILTVSLIFFLCVFLFY
ncbi:hypothetical protein ACFL35_12220 [Candidatus Riflebacteria bacterium]